MSRWGMVIDLQRCVGCYACAVACKQEHFLPPGIFWGTLLISEGGEDSVGISLVYPVLCNHCKEPICVEVCPAGASIKREDGIVFVDNDKCVGCRYCLVACPYQQRSFLGDKDERYFKGQSQTELELMGQKLYPLTKGTVTKCNFCMERIDEGLRQGLRPGMDREATPACVNACPAKARYFGDLDDIHSNISGLIKEKKAIPLHQEFGTEPSVYYIPR